MQQLLACDAIQFRSSLPLGGNVVRVVERRASSCVIDFWEDVEAMDEYWRCELPLPLPLAPWLGLQTPISNFPPRLQLLDGIRSSCTLVGSCCIATGFCPPRCDSTFVRAPSVACQ
jgi:hypothetical protein